MIVVDANVLAYFWPKSLHFEAVSKLYEAEPYWIVPELCKSEFRNITATYIRKGLYTPEIKWSITQKENRMMGSYLAVDSFETLSLVSQTSSSAYHCEYVALAKKTMRPLITFNKKVLRKFLMYPLRSINT